MRILTKAVSLFILLGCVAWAQRDLGTIVGTVTDPQGGVLPKAQVTITEESTGLKYNVVTGEGGDFIRPALKPGTYTVEVEAAGFRKSVQRNVVLTAGDRTGVNIQLTIGEVTQSVEVTADAPFCKRSRPLLAPTSIRNRFPSCRSEASAPSLSSRVCLLAFFLRSRRARRSGRRLLGKWRSFERSEQLPL